MRGGILSYLPRSMKDKSAAAAGTGASADPPSPSATAFKDPSDGDVQGVLPRDFRRLNYSERLVRNRHHLRNQVHAFWDYQMEKWRLARVDEVETDRSGETTFISEILTGRGGQLEGKTSDLDWNWDLDMVVPMGWKLPDAVPDAVFRFDAENHQMRVERDERRSSKVAALNDFSLEPEPDADGPLALSMDACIWLIVGSFVKLIREDSAWFFKKIDKCIDVFDIVTDLATPDGSKPNRFISSTYWRYFLSAKVRKAFKLDQSLTTLEPTFNLGSPQGRTTMPGVPMSEEQVKQRWKNLIKHAQRRIKKGEWATPENKTNLKKALKVCLAIDAHVRARPAVPVVPPRPKRMTSEQESAFVAQRLLQDVSAAFRKNDHSSDSSSSDDGEDEDEEEEEEQRTPQSEQRTQPQRSRMQHSRKQSISI